MDTPYQLEKCVLLQNSWPKLTYDRIVNTATSSYILSIQWLYAGKTKDIFRLTKDIFDACYQVLSLGTAGDSSRRRWQAFLACRFFHHVFLPEITVSIFCFLK